MAGILVICGSPFWSHSLRRAIPGPRPKMVSWIGAPKDSSHTWRPWQDKCRLLHRIPCSKSYWAATLQKGGPDWRPSRIRDFGHFEDFRSMSAPSWKSEALGDLVYYNSPETLTESNFFLVCCLVNGLEVFELQSSLDPGALPRFLQVDLSVEREPGPMALIERLQNFKDWRGANVINPIRTLKYVVCWF